MRSTAINRLLFALLALLIVFTLGASSLLNLATQVRGILAIANGGNGTSSPSLTAGTNVTLSGSWPNYTINATNSGGGGTIAGSLFMPNALAFVGNAVPGEPGASDTGVPVISSNMVYQNGLTSPILIQYVGNGGVGGTSTVTFNSDNTNNPTTQVWSNCDNTVGGAANRAYLFVPSGNNYVSVGNNGVGGSGSGEYYKLPSLSDSGDLVGSRALSTVYQNTSSNLMFVVAQLTSVSDSTLKQGYSDSSATPTTLKFQTIQDGACAATSTVIVMPGHYYKVVSSTGTISHWHEYQVNVATSISANLTGSRSVNSTVQNTGTKDILALASYSATSTGTSSCQAGRSSSLLLSKDSNSTNSSTKDMTVWCIVHPGYFYRMNRDAGTPTLTFWYEITLG